MSINQKFVIWCVRQCLPLWDYPNEVIYWMNDPLNLKKAKEAKEETGIIARAIENSVAY